MKDSKGRPRPRPAVAKVACEVVGGCPKGTPTTAHLVELSNRNYQALAVYREVKAVGPTPEQLQDALFRKVMATIDSIVELHERKQAIELGLLGARK